MLARIFLTFTCCLAILFAFAPAAPALDDEEYKELLVTSPEYAEAEVNLSRAWKDLQQASAADPELARALLADQHGWLESGRDAEAALLMQVPADQVAELTEYNLMPTRQTAYALATKERAGKLRIFTEQLTRNAPVPLIGRPALLEGESGGLYQFQVGAFRLPFTVCTEAQLTALAPEAQDALQGKLVSEDTDMFTLTGYFKLPGVYQPDRNIRLQFFGPGMAWQEQDRYFDQNNPD